MMRALIAALGMLVVPALAEAPPPTFTIEGAQVVCGSAEDQRRVLEASEFEPVWRGDAAAGGGVVAMVNHEGYWILLAWWAEAPGRLCVVGMGERFVYGGAPR